MKTRKITKRWTTRDGVKIRICDMTDDHLQNAIRLCEQRVEAMKATIPYPNFHGEMAQMHAEGEYEHLMEADPTDIIPILSDLYCELGRRH